MQLILVMPAYNEEGCIEAVVREWHQELERTIGPGEFRLLLVNDGSRDGTGAILDALSLPGLEVVHQANQGHGATVLNGYRHAVTLGAEYVFQVDSDNQVFPHDLARLWERRRESDFILGLRAVRHDPRQRLLISRTLAWIIFVLFGRSIPDVNVPFRLMRSDYLARLLRGVPPYMVAPNIILGVLAACDGQPLLNVPIQHRERQTGEVSIVRWSLMRICLRSAADLVELRLRRRRSLERVRHG